MKESKHAGQGLHIFARATNWKRYWAMHIRPFLTGDVLEVGAGLGANTRFLWSQEVSSWTCLEPDPELAAEMAAAFMADAQLRDCRVETGTIGDIGTARSFDAVVYVDVLEHIVADRLELDRAAHLLRRGGRIIVLAPAHQWLFTRFDSAVGHYRRYNRASLRALTPERCRLIRLFYLDSAGMLASLANRLYLRRPIPKQSEILLWDRALVPLSRYVDRACFHMVGKSVLAVWQLDAFPSDRSPQYFRA